MPISKEEIQWLVKWYTVDGKKTEKYMRGKRWKTPPSEKVGTAYFVTNSRLNSASTLHNPLHYTTVINATCSYLSAHCFHVYELLIFGSFFNITYRCYTVEPRLIGDEGIPGKAKSE